MQRLCDIITSYLNEGNYQFCDECFAVICAMVGELERSGCDRDDSSWVRFIKES